MQLEYEKLLNKSQLKMLVQPSRVRMREPRDLLDIYRDDYKKSLDDAWGNAYNYAKKLTSKSLGCKAQQVIHRLKNNPKYKYSHAYRSAILVFIKQELMLRNRNGFVYSISWDSVHLDENNIVKAITDNPNYVAPTVIPKLPDIPERRKYFVVGDDGTKKTVNNIKYVLRENGLHYYISSIHYLRFVEEWRNRYSTRWSKPILKEEELVKVLLSSSELKKHNLCNIWR